MSARISALMQGPVGLVLLVLLLLSLSQAARQWNEAELAQRLRELARPGDILMLASRSCIYCQRAKRWLDAEQVPYRMCLIEQDAACAHRYAALQAPGTPTFVVRGARVIGWDRAALLRALEQAPIK
ncbi:glutaredoxin family protein [Paucibacter soli]|uniref:glutaredoxin family protein n=1 Tax=Paucibacter soli TaxID=3133433 RepID=UPI0030B0F377